MLSFLLFLCALLGAVWLVRHPPSGRGRLWASWIVVAMALVIAATIAPPIFLLRKFFAALLMPLPLIWIGLVWTCWATRKERRLRVAMLAVTAALTLAGNSGIVSLCVRSLEAPYRGLRSLEQPRPFDAVFVLGGGIGAGPDGRPQLTASGDRLRVPALLYLNGRTPTLVASSSTLRGLDVSAVTRDYWRSFGVPEEAIRVIPRPRNTSQEIEAYSRLIEEEGWQRVGLVTSATHMRRAQALCRLQGVSMTPLPADFRGPPNGTIRLSAFLWPIPSAGALAELQIVVWEVLGLLAVHLMGF